MEALRATFRPEFLNRIDDVIVFRRLSTEQIGGIVKLQLRQLSRTLAQKDLALEISPEAAAELAVEGYDPAYGARPLKRLIQKKIQDKLALMLLNGDLLSGDTVHLGWDRKREEFTFSK
jgi:ATP-dependent Clp protease ATP-binding subunit ClpB